MQPRFLKDFVNAYSTGPSRAFLRSYEADLLSQITLNSPVLDLACGDGRVSALTYGQALDHGCDLMMSQLQKANQRGQYRNLVLSDVRELPYNNFSFATVISNSSLEHIPRVEKVLQEIFRVLKTDGQFVFTVPGLRFNEWFWQNWIWSYLGNSERGRQAIQNFNKSREHYNVYDASRWHQLLEKSGFSSVRIREYFPFRATFIFSLLESMWNKSIVLPWSAQNGSTGKRINLAGGSLRLLPRRMRVFLQIQFLAFFSRENYLEHGSHLFIVSRK